MTVIPECGIFKLLSAIFVLLPLTTHISVVNIQKEWWITRSEAKTGAGQNFLQLNTLFRENQKAPSGFTHNLQPDLIRGRSNTWNSWQQHQVIFCFLESMDQGECCLLTFSVFSFPLLLLLHWFLQQLWLSDELKSQTNSLHCWIRIFTLENQMPTTQMEPASATCPLQSSHPKFCEPLLPGNKSSTVSPNIVVYLNGSFLLKKNLKHIRAERPSLGKIRLEPARSLQNYQCTFQKVSFYPLENCFIPCFRTQIAFPCAEKLIQR